MNPYRNMSMRGFVQLLGDRVSCSRALPDMPRAHGKARAEGPPLWEQIGTRLASGDRTKTTSSEQSLWDGLARRFDADASSTKASPAVKTAHTTTVRTGRHAILTTQSNGGSHQPTHPFASTRCTATRTPKELKKLQAETWLRGAKPGTCGFTESAEGDCNAGKSGSWPLDSAETITYKGKHQHEKVLPACSDLALLCPLPSALWCAADVGALGMLEMVQPMSTLSIHHNFLQIQRLLLVFQLQSNQAQEVR